jgi:hypothetical protein
LALGRTNAKNSWIQFRKVQRNRYRKTVGLANDQGPTTKGQQPGHAKFLNTSAEFFEPNAMQLHTACSMAFLRPISGT